MRRPSAKRAFANGCKPLAWSVSFLKRRQGLKGQGITPVGGDAIVTQRRRVVGGGKLRPRPGGAGGAGRGGRTRPGGTGGEGGSRAGGCGWPRRWRHTPPLTRPHSQSVSCRRRRRRGPPH